MRFSWSLVRLILSAFRDCEARLKIAHKYNKAGHVAKHTTPLCACRM